MKWATQADHDIGIFLSAVRAEKKTISYKRREVIFSQGDPSAAMFYIESGTLKLSLVSAEGKEAIICVSNGGTLFGESCISSGRPVRFHSAVALTETRLVKIERKAILRVLSEGGDTAVNFVSFLLKQNARLQEDLANRLVGSTEQTLSRVVSSLSHLRTAESDQKLLQISQQTIAEMMGITRQRVNVLMKRFGFTQPSGGATNKLPRPELAARSTPRTTPSSRRNLG